MKILFVVSGIGFGDATREHANILAVKKKFPEAKIMVAAYDNSYSYFKNKFHTIKIQGYKLPGKNMKISAFRFGLKNFLLPAFWVHGTLKVRLEAFNFIPDLIVSDFEPIGISLAKVLNKPCIVVFGYDPDLYKAYLKKKKASISMKVEAVYFSKLYDQASHVIIPSLRHPDKKHLRYSYISPILREEINNLPKDSEIMKGLGLKKKPILISLGGSNFGHKLVKGLNKVAHKFKEDFIIFGGDLDFPLAKNIQYISFTDELLKYLKVAKGVITLGGQQTLAEALAFKKPILCYPIQDHVEQILNAYSLRETIQISHKHSPKEIENDLKKFLRDLKKIETKVKKLNLQGNGSEQVAKIINIYANEQIKKKF
jgi:uncharacterized protein (TIGR00661 family)